MQGLTLGGYRAVNPSQDLPNKHRTDIFISICKVVLRHQENAKSKVLYHVIPPKRTSRDKVDSSQC